MFFKMDEYDKKEWEECITEVQKNVKSFCWHLKTFLWMSYFGITALAYFVCLFLEIRSFPFWTSWDFLSSVLGITLVYGIYAYVLRTPMLTHRFWKLFLWLSFTLAVFNFFYIATALKTVIPLPGFFYSHLPTLTVAQFLIAVVAFLPAGFVMYSLGYKEWGSREYDPSWAYAFPDIRRPMEIKTSLRTTQKDDTVYIIEKSIIRPGKINYEI